MSISTSISMSSDIKDLAGVNVMYSRERVTSVIARVTSVIARVRRTGGLPIPPRPLDQYQSWFRTLAKRGYVQPDFLRDDDRVRQAFRRDFLKGTHPPEDFFSWVKVRSYPTK
jgi:hypothetical protein